MPEAVGLPQTGTMDDRPTEARTSASSADQPGLPLRREPTASAPAAIGVLWGLAGYAILWEGVPIEVSRPFVESVPGTLALLPARIVIWGILAVEGLVGRTFDLSTSYTWIAPAAAATGALIAVVLTLATTRALRLRSARGAVRQPL